MYIAVVKLIWILFTEIICVVFHYREIIIRVEWLMLKLSFEWVQVIQERKNIYKFERTLQILYTHWI